MRIMAFTSHNSEKFALHIEQLVHTHRISYMDAILLFCEKRGVEPELVVPLLTDKMRAAVAQEAQRLHMIKKTNTLPVE